jgi:hypothetical protein
MVAGNKVLAEMAKTQKRETDEDNLWGHIGSHQEAVHENDESKSKSYIRHLSNNKIKTKERTLKEAMSRRGKNGNNSK